MKLTISSLFILLSIFWNIGVTDYITIVSNPLPQTNESSLIPDNFHINSPAKKIQFEVVYEELTENEEEVEHEFLSFFIENYLFLIQDSNVEDFQYEIINESLPPIKRLFIKLCSLKIPLS